MNIDFKKPGEGGLTFNELEKGKLYYSASTAPQPHYDYTRKRDVIFTLGKHRDLLYFNKVTKDFGPCNDAKYDREPYFELPAGTTVTLTSE